jgi:hypothetical protein
MRLEGVSNHYPTRSSFPSRSAPNLGSSSRPLFVLENKLMSWNLYRNRDSSESSAPASPPAQTDTEEGGVGLGFGNGSMGKEEFGARSAKPAGACKVLAGSTLPKVILATMPRLRGPDPALELSPPLSNAFQDKIYGVDGGSFTS